MSDFSGNIRHERPINFILSSVSQRSMDSRLFCNDLLDKFEIEGVKFLNEEVNMDPGEMAKD